MEERFQKHPGDSERELGELQGGTRAREFIEVSFTLLVNEKAPSIFTKAGCISKENTPIFLNQRSLGDWQIFAATSFSEQFCSSPCCLLPSLFLAGEGDLQQASCAGSR